MGSGHHVACQCHSICPHITDRMLSHLVQVTGNCYYVLTTAVAGCGLLMANQYLYGHANVLPVVFGYDVLAHLKEKARATMKETQCPLSRTLEMI